MSAGRPTSQLQQAIAVQLIHARGFPRSTEQLAGELAGQRMLLTSGQGSIRVGRAEIVAALAAMHRDGLVVRVAWPGPNPPVDHYWVLPESPWAG